MRGSNSGLPENPLGHSPGYYALLTVLDSLFGALLVCPFVVGYWRSVWCLMDCYAWPKDDVLSGAISTAIGLCGHVFFTLSQKAFEKNFHPDVNRILYYLVSRSYTVCFAFICVNGWRGPWNILDHYAGDDLAANSVSVLAGIVALMALRCMRNVSAPPSVIVTDGVKGYFEVLTLFRTLTGEKLPLYILDCLFSVVVVGTLVVLVWRGVWILIDVLLFPENAVWSAWGSLIIGYIAVGIAFLLQPLMRYLCEKLTGIPRLLTADIFILYGLFGTVNVWRGIWNLLNIYFLPDNIELSCWITHWSCLILLILLGCSNSLLVRGVYIDAEEPDGRCVVFPCYYLRVIFQKEKLKKIKTNHNIDLGEHQVQRKEIDNNHFIPINAISILQENHKESSQ